MRGTVLYLYAATANIDHDIIAHVARASDSEASRASIFDRPLIDNIVLVLFTREFLESEMFTGIVEVVGSKFHLHAYLCCHGEAA